MIQQSSRRHCKHHLGLTQLTINWLSVVFLSSRCVAKEVWGRLLWEAKTGGLLTHEEEGKWRDRMWEEHPAIAPKENIQDCRFAAALVQVPLPKLKWLLNCQALSPRGSAHWLELLIEYSSTNLLTNLLPTAESPEYYKHSCRLFPSQNWILNFLRSLSAWV